MMNAVYKANGRTYPYFDCYGMVKHLYKQEHGVDIVDFDYVDPDDKENEKFFYESLENPRWEKVQPKKGAVVAMRVNGAVTHCGFMVNDKEFIHIMERTGVDRVKINSPKWKQMIVGFYKYD